MLVFKTTMRPGEDLTDGLAMPKRARSDDVFDPTMVDAIIGTGATRQAGREFLQQVLKLSLSRADDIMKQLFSAHAAMDEAGVKRSAHQLISSLGNLGASEMVKLCRAIQVNAVYDAEIAALRAAFERFHAALQDHITD